MLIKYATGLLLICIFQSCTLHPPKQMIRSQDTNGQLQNPKVALHIKTSPNRGLNYTTISGVQRSFRYIPITLTNNNSRPIRIEMGLAAIYPYPPQYGKQEFDLILLPKEIITDEITWDSVSYELEDNMLRQFFDADLNPPYQIDERLDSGEQFAIAIGTLYPRPTSCGVLPSILFIQDRIDRYSECDELLNPLSSWASHSTLALKLDFCQSCAVVPCGQISYIVN